nr:MAG TPA: Endo N acetylneuraminidase [Caudoviricetes sp.]
MTEKTKNIGLTKPDETEFYDVNVTNENWDITDKEIGNIKNPEIKEASARENIENGDNYFTILGKIKKFFSDLKNVAFTGEYQDLEGKPEIPAAIAVKGNAETNYRTGNVNLTPDDIGAATSADLTAHKKIEAITNIGNTHPLGHVMVYDEKEEATGTNQCAVPSLDLFQREINSLNSSLAKCLSVDGQHATYNPVSDLNGFYNGIGLFTAPTLNMPGDGWYLIISSGVPNTVCQRAVNLFGGSACYRYCASNNWSSWAVDNYLPVSGGTITGNISTNGGATFAIDGNVYLNSNGYKDWLTSILDTKLPTSASCNKNWNWEGRNETPAWIWGGNDGTNMYVYNPTYILVQGIRNRVTNRAMTITDDNHVRTYESNGVGMNGAISLGSGNHRFSQLYVTSSSISTSDKNYKDDIKSLTNKHLQFFMKLQPVSFLFKDGTSGRTHIGFIAQDVEQAMSECGLTDLDFAGFCKDQKIDSKLVDGEEVNEPILDDNGNPEYIYSLRYEEFIALNTYAIQKLWNHVETLEKENIEMKNQIKSMQQDIAELKKSRT